MKNNRRIDWRKTNLYQEDFTEYCTHLPSYQLAIKMLVLSILLALIGILASLAAIFAIGLRSLETDFLGVLARLLAALLAITGLIITHRRGVSTFIGLGITTFVILGILLLVFRTGPLINVFSVIPFTITSELLALWLSGIVFASIRALSKRILLLLSVPALCGIGITLFIARPWMTYLAIDWLYGLLSVSILFAGGSIGWNAFNANTKFPRIAQIAINFTAVGGTSFRQANLTEADFSGATLKQTDFRDADLTRTYWRNAKGLEFARLGNTYLANYTIRQLVVTCDGRGQNFDELDLARVNLQNANLQDASFMGANLNQSNLRGADLSRAILKQTQLEGADLSGAILTGAYIEDWGITSTTKLVNVQCKYVYMWVPTKENPNPLRKPDNWQETFAEGEFADFIQPYFDTLDLYHSQDVDPRAISIAFKKLSQNHPEANLEIVAMEKRGHNSFNLKVRTAPAADKSELSSQYFTDYNQFRALSEARLLLLAEKDDRIRSLEQMIQTALHQPTFNVETVQGDFMSEYKGINVSAGDNANISGVSSGDGVINLGTISGSVTNAINQLSDSSETGQVSLKVLLTQLQAAIETDTDLPDSDKSDLLEEVQSLAEAKHDEEPKRREGIARKATKMFDATLKSLPDTAKIVEACSKLLPLILKALGIPT
jgi:uncharacterized protein YjbI with pentapeptide repeats